MAITSSLSADQQELTINVSGRFDFSTHQEFRACYENLDGKPQRFVIDMKEATYLDSSALGMLLLLRDFAGGDDADVCLNNCSRDIKKILTISNFEQLFVVQ